jgi:hypothetical protein
MEQLGSDWTDFLWNLILCFSKMWRKFECHYNPPRITGSLHEDLCVFMAVSRWILLRMRNVSAKRCREKSKHILCSRTFFRKSCRLWDNVEKYGEDDEDTDNIIRRMRCACWITKATNTHSGGTRWRSWLRHCATNWKVAGSIPDGVTGIFQWLDPSGRIVALGSTQPLTEVSTRDLSWGWRRPVCRADNLTTFMCRLSRNSGASTSWNPKGLSRPVAVNLCFPPPPKCTLRVCNT